jgi:hypothetical protein
MRMFNTEGSSIRTVQIPKPGSRPGPSPFFSSTKKSQILLTIYIISKNTEEKSIYSPLNPKASTPARL